MKYRINIINEPTSKKAALQIAASIVQAREQNSTRKENLMKSKTQTQQKIEKLQKVLEDINNQISEAEASDKINEDNLKKLQEKFEFTEAEILELRSSTLRKQLQSLEKQGILQSAMEKNI